MATLDEIYDEWMKDSEIDITDLGNASINTPKLHHKYQRMLSRERLVLRKFETDLDVLANNKRSWMDGSMSQQELKELGWSPHLKRLTKGEIEVALKSDPDMIKGTLKVATQAEKVLGLESIMKSIMTRSYHINNAINDLKFKAGIGG